MSFYSDSMVARKLFCFRFRLDSPENFEHKNSNFIAVGCGYRWLRHSGETNSCHGRVTSPHTPPPSSGLCWQCSLGMVIWSFEKPLRVVDDPQEETAEVAIVACWTGFRCQCWHGEGRFVVVVCHLGLASWKKRWQRWKEGRRFAEDFQLETCFGCLPSGIAQVVHLEEVIPH